MSLTQTIARLSAASPALLPVVLDAAVKSVAILLLTAAATWAMRRASAAARYLVWMLGLASLLLLPIFSAALPGWQVLPTWDVPNVKAIASISPIPDEPALSPSPDRAGTEGRVRVQPSRNGLQIPAFAEPDERPPLPPDRRASPPATPEPQPAAVHLLWQGWLLLGWLIGTLLLLTHILLGFTSLILLRRRAASITDETWSAQCRELSAQLGLRRRVELLSSGDRTMPMVWGIFRIRLLLPADASSWTDEQRRAVLLHELAHAKRGDCLSQLLAQLIRALYWFNPLAWLACRRMQIEREMACDDLVLRGGGRPSAYAEQLLQIAASMRPAPLQPAAIAMARPSHLEGRLLAILDAGRNRRMAAATVIATLLTALAVTAAIAMLRGTPAKPTSADITLLTDSAGDPLSKKSPPIEIDKPQDVAALSAFFPQLGKTSGSAAGWPAGAQIIFHYPDGKKTTVVVSASDAFGQWTEGRGDWPVKGDLTAYLNKLRPAETGDGDMAQARFGQTIVRTIETPPNRELWDRPDGLPDKPAAGGHFLSFRSGALIGLPTNLLEDDDDAAKQWLEDQGIDIVANRSLDDWNAREIDSFNDHVRFKEIDRNAWDSLPPAKFEAKWHSDGANDVSALSDTIQVADWARLPRTFLFETRAGDKGMLQIVRMVNAPDAIQIRYRLMEDANTPANPSATDAVDIQDLRTKLADAHLAEVEAETNFDAAREVHDSPDKLRSMAGPGVVAQLDPKGQTLRTQLGDVELQIDLLIRKGQGPNSALVVEDQALAEEIQKQLKIADASFADAYLGSLYQAKMKADEEVRMYTDALRTGVMPSSLPPQPGTQPGTAPTIPIGGGHSPRDVLRAYLTKKHEAQQRCDDAEKAKDDPEKLRNLAGPAMVEQLDPDGQELRTLQAGAQSELDRLLSKGNAPDSPALKQVREGADKLAAQIKISDQKFAAAYLKKCHETQELLDEMADQLHDEISKHAAATLPATQPVAAPATRPAGSSDAQTIRDRYYAPPFQPKPPLATPPATAPATTQPAGTSPADAADPLAHVRRLSRKSLAKIATATRGTLDAASGLPNWDHVHVPPSCWKPEIAALKPIRIEEEEQTQIMRIVLFSQDGVKDGLLARPTTSSTLSAPPAGEVDTPLFDPWGKTATDDVGSFVGLSTFRSAPPATAPAATRPASGN